MSRVHLPIAGCFLVLLVLNYAVVRLFGYVLPFGIYYCFLLMGLKIMRRMFKGEGMKGADKHGRSSLMAKVVFRKILLVGLLIRVSVVDGNRAGGKEDHLVFYGSSDDIGSLRKPNDFIDRYRYCTIIYRQQEMLGRKISGPSGYGKCQFSCSKIILQPSISPLMVEPTKILDTSIKEMSEEARIEHQGTVTTGSHDCYLLKQLVTRALEIKEREEDFDETEAIGIYVQEFEGMMVGPLATEIWELLKRALQMGSAVLRSLS